MYNTGFCDDNKLIFTLPRKGKGLEKRNAKSLAPPALSCHIGDNVGLSFSSCVRSFRSAPSARVIFHGFPLSAAAVAAEDDLEEERTTDGQIPEEKKTLFLSPVQHSTPLPSSSVLAFGFSFSQFASVSVCLPSAVLSPSDRFLLRFLAANDVQFSTVSQNVFKV